MSQRNYRLFLAGQLVSLLGTWTQTVAQAWLVYRLTGSAVWLGIVALCQQAPIVAFASVGGSLADHHGRRTILIVSQSAALVLAAVLAALALTGTVRLAHVVALAALAGVVNAVDMPTRQSFVIELVGRDALPTAVAINSAMAMCAASLGPVLAGFGVTAFGEGWCFVANSVSFTAVITALAAMRDLPAPAAARTVEPLATRIAHGFRFAREHARVRALFALLAITALAGLPYGTLLPVFASDIFHGDARALGELSAAAGLGALLGAAVLAFGRRRAGLHVVGVACGALGVLLVGFARSHTLGLSLALLVPLGAATMIQVSATNTLIQIATPDALRGRVMAIWAMVLMGFAPLGALAASAVAAVTTPGTPLAIGGAVCVVAAAAFSVRARRLETSARDTARATRPAARETPH